MKVAVAVHLLALVLCVTSLAPAQERTRADTSARSAGHAANRASASQREIMRRIQESGMSREQVRQRLRDSGYDPALADPYFDHLSRTDTTAEAGSSLSRLTRPLPTPSGNLLTALRRIGILAAGDSLPADREPSDSSLLRQRTARPRSTEPQVFGRELFAATTQFSPQTVGPVDPDYRFGPGDELTLVVTGDVEFAYDLEISREGYIIVPEVGQVLVNGLTLDQLKSRLNDRLARVYSGVQIGTMDADVTVGKLRSKLVYVIGEAEVPGAYQLPGSATVFAALYRAGGPALSGSFRNIEVRRQGRIVQVVDLYDYLLKGDKRSDLRLEQGDVVFVPVVGKQVTIVGSVRRPAIYETKESEALIDVIAFAGGVEAAAAVERVQVDRILPPGQRQPGRERVLVDVALAEMLAGKPIAVLDGDRVRVSSISDVRRNRVVVTGDIQRPGEYEFRSGMTAQELIQAAQGLLPTAYTPTAHIVRINPADSSTAIVRISLDDPVATDHASRVRLEDLDEIVVFGRARLANPRNIEIFGYVKNPGTYSFSDGMTIQDLVLLAGGFKEGAADGEVEVARRIDRGGLSDTLATVHRVTIDMAVSPTSKGSSSSLFLLADGDQIFVRRMPGYEPLSTVEIVGEVVYPGPYTVGSRSERVSDILSRAGGLTPEAFPKGFRLIRDGKPVGVDLPKAIARRGGPDDMLIEPGDRLEIPRVDPTVLVTGAVQFESRVRYEKGLNVEDYLARAGGVRDDGNASRLAVRYANGELRTPGRLLWFRTYPKVEPGSTITVPTRADARGFDWDRFLTRSMTVLSTMATVILTVRAID